MALLLVNPGTPAAWEIQLKPGNNFIGRGFANDFQIDDGSVSSSHCRLHVENGSVRLFDQGSTNGTFVNGAPVTEALLQPGQTIRLGSVEMRFDAASSTVAANESAAKETSPVGGVLNNPASSAGGVKLRVSGLRHEEAPLPAETLDNSAEPPPVAPVSTSPAYCKYHPKTLARLICTKCHKTFCDLCVNAHAGHGTVVKNCRSCGGICAPLQVNVASLYKARPTFFKSLPGAILYPFRGIGWLMLLCAAIVFAVLERMSGIFSILLTLGAIGYLFAYMQNIIHCTVSDEDEPLSMPEGDGLFGACFRLVGTVLVAFGLSLGLLIARFYGAEIPTVAIVIAAVFGCIYFPMAILAVAMKDTIMAANPLVVIPSILKMPLEYPVAAIVFMGVLGIRQVGNIVSGVAGDVTYSTKDMSVLFMAMGFGLIWSFVSVYLLTVSMRVLGLLYLSKKDDLEWF